MIAPSSNHLLLLIFSTYSEDLTLFDRRAYFGPLKTQGEADLPPNFFPELLEGVTCWKRGLKLSSPKNIFFMAQFRYLGFNK